MESEVADSSVVSESAVVVSDPSVVSDSTVLSGVISDEAALEADSEVLATSEDVDFSEVESSPLPSNRASRSMSPVEPEPSTVLSVVASESVTSVSNPVASLSISSSVSGDASVEGADEKSIPLVSSESSIVTLTTPS